MKPFLIFLFLIIIANSVALEEYQTLDSIYPYVANYSCKTTASYGVTGMPNCYYSPENGSIFNKVIDDLATNAASEAGNFTMWINLSFAGKMPVANKVMFATCDLDKVAPRSITFNFCLNESCSYTQTWTNTNFECNDIAGCMSNPIKVNVSLNQNVTNFNQVKMTVIPKYCKFGTWQRADFSEFNFSYVKYRENHLPNINVSYISNYINLNNDSWAYFNFTINATDEESDTIYYASNPSEEYIVNKQITFDRDVNGGIYIFNYILYCKILDPGRAWGLCTDYEEHGVYLDNEITNGNILTLCPYTTDINYPQNDSITYGFTSVQDHFYYLRINASKPCAYPHDVYLPVENKALGFTLAMEDNSEAFMIGSRGGSTSCGLVMNESGGYTSIYYCGNGVTVASQDMDITWIFNNEANKETITIMGSSNNLLYMNDSYPSEGIDQFLWRSNANTIGIDNIFTYTSNYSLSWSTTKPHVMALRRIGLFYLELYVTDSYHIGSEYRKIRIPVYVGGYNNTALGSLINNPVISPGYNFFHNFFSDIGMEEQIAAVMWLAWIITLLIIWGASKSFADAFTFSSIFYFVLCLFGFGNTGNLVAFLILTAVSLVPHVIQIWIPITRR